MGKVSTIKDGLLKKVPHSYRRKLRNITRIVTSRFPVSLRPPLPRAVTIDPINTCNLKCPLCPTGSGKLRYKKQAMSLGTFKNIVDRIPDLKHVCLYNWGEPFLNPSIFKMIEYVKAKKARVQIHSNFSFKKDEKFFLRILKSGLDELVISLDGASDRTYSKYRIGGDFHLVMSNMHQLAGMKNELHYENPSILWKFIVNKFDEKDVTAAKKMADDLGIEFETAYMGLSDDLPGFESDESIEKRKEHWLPEDEKYLNPSYRDQYRVPLNDFYCTQLFETMIINPDGKVFPCCWATDEEYVFGDMTKESFEEIWYGPQYLYSRSLFSKQEYAGPKVKTPCLICNNFKKIKK